MSTFGVEHAASYAESTDRFLVHGSGTIPASGFLRGEWSTTSPVLQRVVAVSVAMREVFSDIYLFSENTHTVCA